MDVIGGKEYVYEREEEYGGSKKKREGKNVRGGKKVSDTGKEGIRKEAEVKGIKFYDYCAI